MVSDTGWILFGILAGVFILIIAAYLFLGNRIESRNRLNLIRKFRALPQKIAGKPVLIHGTAGPKSVILPAGGDPVAFHATFIMSSGCSFFMQSGFQKALPERSSFRIFLTSGDFTVTEAGVPYTVSILSALGRMDTGAEYFTHKHKANAILDGIPEIVFDDMVQFIAGSQALGPVFGIVGTGSSFTSTIDSRVRTFRQGTDLPPGIAEILKGRIIRPRPGEEITVIEFFIPLKKGVWVFGEFDGSDTVRYHSNAGLYVSYTDPETEGGTA